MTTEAQELRQAIQKQIAEHLRIGWGKLFLHLWVAVSWVLLTFFRTGNLSLRISAVIVGVALALLAVNRRYLWRDRKVPYVDEIAYVALILCGIVYLSLSVHLPEVWFFAPAGVILILTGFLLFLFSLNSVWGTGEKRKNGQTRS
jgi:hypothetical protein